MDEDQSSFSIDVATPDADVPFEPARVREAVERTLRRQRCPAAQISVALVNDERIADLNQRFLGHAGPTDCITFDLADDAESTIEGEVVISWETADREARRRGREPISEILLYAVHGTLHLLGLDDASDDEASEMHAIEDEILAGMGLGPVFTGGPS